MSDERSEQTPGVSVVIPARNAAATLGRVLAALEHQDLDAAFETIVVDNGSTDATRAVAEAAPLDVRLAHGLGLGPGSARNTGAALAQGDVIAFLDADCLPTQGWLREGLAALAELDFVQGRVEAEPGVAIGPFDHTVWVTRRSALYETANVLVRRELFERLGGFEDWLATGPGRPFGEDVWFGWRASRRGARMGFAERSVVHHVVVPRGPRAYIAERARLRWFPETVRKVPELRREFLRLGVFLTPRSGRFDLAVAGGVAAAVTRSALPLAGSLPYVLEIGRIALPHRRNAPRVAGVEIAADALGLAALALGSIRARSLVL